jgi:hypothetical protein
VTRLIRVLSAPFTSTLAVLLCACGTNHSSTTAAAPKAQTDTALARRTLSEQLVVMHRMLPIAWRENAAPDDALRCSDTAIRAGRTARAVSPSIEYKRMEVGTGTYVYATSRAASRALLAFADETLQTCRGQFLVAALRTRGYTTGSPNVRTHLLAGVGQGANATEITIPSHYQGRPFTWNLDETLVRQGRRIELLDTLAGASTARYNQALAAAIAKITSVEQ